MTQSAREAARAAAEARLRGEPSPAEKEEQLREEAARKRREEVWVPPGEKADIECKRTFARLLDRGIIRDNGYRQALACVETLLKIADNILNDPSNDPKFRSLKASNVTIRNKILNCKGGHDYLIALGFRTRTVEFSMTYTLEPKLKRMHELRLGRDVLDEHIPDLQKRVDNMRYSQSAHDKEEAARKAKALAEIDADRDLVKTRVERERRLREYRATVDRDAQQRKMGEAILVNYHPNRGEPAIAENPEEEEQQVMDAAEAGADLSPRRIGEAMSGTDEGEQDQDDDTYDPYLGNGRKLGS